MRLLLQLELEDAGEKVGAVRAVHAVPAACWAEPAVVLGNPTGSKKWCAEGACCVLRCRRLGRRRGRRTRGRRSRGGLRRVREATRSDSWL